MQFFGHGNLDWGALAPLAFGLLTVILAVLVLNRFVRARRKPPPDLRLNDAGQIRRLLQETADLNGRFDVSLERAPQRLMACLLTEVTDEALLVEPPATVKPTESLIGQNVDCYLTVGSGEGMLFYSFSSHITGIRKGKRPALLLDPPTVMHPYSRRSALRSDIPEDVTAEARVWDVADSLKLDKADPEAWNAPLLASTGEAPGRPVRLDDISSMGVRLGNVPLQANRPFAERHPALVLQLSLTDPADRERINDFWLVAEPRNERAEAEDGETRGQLGLAFTHYAEPVEEGLAWHKLEHGDEVPGLGDTVFRYHVLVHRARKGLDDEDQAQRERRRAEKLDSDLDDIINRSGRKG